MKKEMKAILFGCILSGIALIASIVVLVTDDFNPNAVLLVIGMALIFFANLARYIGHKRHR